MKGFFPVLCAGTALTGVMTAAPANAQQDTSATAPSAAPDQSGPAGDIVVTAQRRSEKVTDVPASITVLSTATLKAAGVTNSLDLEKVTPGLTMPSYGAFVQPALRGVTSGGANVGESSNVATYIDGVYQPQQISNLLELPDIERIEVLKGPQGALYGQNATGGAILVNTLSPSFTTSGDLSASYGNYNDVNLRGYVTRPLSDTLAVSLAANYHNHDGYRRNVATDKRDFGLNSKSVRGKILFEPTPAVRLTLTGYYTDRKDSSAYAGQPYDNNSIGYSLIPGAPRATSPKQFAADPDVFTRISSKGLNLRGEFDVGLGTITNITSYSHNKASYISDADYSPVQYAEAYTPSLAGHYFITDTNFASRKMGPVTFLAGVFYLKGSETFDVNGFRLFNPSLPPDPKVVIYDLPTIQRVRKEILAGYGQVTLEPVDRVFITAGGRYTSEKQRGYSDFGGPEMLAFPGNPVSFKEFTPRVTARYQITPDANVYASWAKGFKSGGINLSDFTLAPFKPEKITSYEIGFKGKITDGLRLNVSAFLYDYKDIQIVQYNPPIYIEENAASAKIKGVDFDLTWRVAPGLTLSGGGTYLDAHYGGSSVATVFEPNGAGNTPVADTPIGGNQMIRAPKFSGNVAIDYKLNTDAGQFGAHVGAYYNSGFALEVSNRIHQPKFATVDADLSFSPDSLKGVRLVVWGKNLSDKAYLSSLLQTNFADGVSYAEPRTFGVRAEYSF